MKIAQSNISFAAGHSFGEENSSRESVHFWRNAPGTEPLRFVEPDTLTLSVEAVTQPFKNYSSAHYPAAVISSGEAQHPELLVPRLTLEGLTGRKIVLNSFNPGQNSTESPNLQASPPALSLEQPEVPVAGPGWGMAYDYFESRREEESLRFSAGGTVSTVEGRQFDFAFEQVMSREFYRETSLPIEAGAGARTPVDPLVINLDGKGIGLGRFSLDFDLDGDGWPEEISFVSPGSGFLALDLNNDGTINDGTELFGPQTGNGFAELAKFDGDGNGWLDENDPIYAELKIWMADQSGSLALFSLSELDVGAIFLGAEDTEFTFKDDQNNSLAHLKSSSIALGEQGTVFYLGELDLFV